MAKRKSDGNTNGKTRWGKIILTICAFFMLTGLVEAGQVTLQWKRNTDTVTAGYEIRYGTQYGSIDNVIDVGDTDHYTIDGLQPGSTYFFHIRAYNANKIYSGNSYTVADEIKLQVPEQLEVIK